MIFDLDYIAALHSIFTALFAPPQDGKLWDLCYHAYGAVAAQSYEKNYEVIMKCMDHSRTGFNFSDFNFKKCVSFDETKEKHIDHCMQSLRKPDGKFDYNWVDYSSTNYSTCISYMITERTVNILHSCADLIAEYRINFENPYFQDCLSSYEGSESSKPKIIKFCRKKLKKEYLTMTDLEIPSGDEIQIKGVNPPETEFKNDLLPIPR
jgi:hypothetical protein